MKYNIKFCENCFKNQNSLAPKGVSEYYAGYMVCINADKLKNITKCPLCGQEGLIEKNITEEEIDLIGKVSNYNRQLLEAMIDLKDKDIIEYQLKFSQFRNQNNQQKVIEVTQNQQKNKVFCPTCNSTNIRKISTVSKIGGTMMFGILSKTAKSQFVCDNCGYKW